MITIMLDEQCGIPLYQQIYAYIIEQISSGTLSAGTKLPSTRLLSENLSISRSTVATAYEQLTSEGYIESIPKSGYYVYHISELLHLNQKKHITYATVQDKGKKPDYDFTPFSVDISNFPYPTWRKLYNTCISDMNQRVLLLGDKQGDLELRQAIAVYLMESRSVNCTPDQIIIGAGNDYLLQLLCQLFKKDNIIAIENPAYMRTFHILQGFGFQILPIPVNSDGIDLKKLAVSNADIVYVTPSHQYPLGVVMPIAKRMELLSWAAQSEQRYIIEDDHDSEFRYKGKPIPALQGEDLNGRVIYMGTFSRAIAPGMRVGYMVLPYDILERYQKNLYYYASSVSRVEQAVLTRFIKEGYFERHLNKMRKLYKSKHDCMIKALKIFGNSISISGENAGLHLVVTFHGIHDTVELLSAFEQSSIKLYDLNNHYIDGFQSSEATVLLGFASIEEDDISNAIQKLKHVYDSISSTFYANTIIK